MPASRIAKSPMITVSVRCALRTVGSRNAFTPLLTASTPVIAVQPLEKTCSSSHALTAAVAGPATEAGGATAGTGCPAAKTVLVRPIRIAMSIEPRNAYVGIMKKTPASRTPRRLTIVTITRIPRQSASVCGCSCGTAETSAPTPAEIPTAAVST